MATSPMMPQGGPAMGMPDAQPGAEAPAATKTVCITANADGSYAVGDHDAYMAQEGGGMGESPDGMGAEATEKPGMTPAASIDEALEMARDLLESERTTPGEDAAMKSAMMGYSKGARPMQGKMNIAKVFGE